MRRTASAAGGRPQSATPARAPAWQTIRSLLPYLWPRGDPGARVRVVLADGPAGARPRSPPSTCRSSTAAPSMRWRRRTTPRCSRSRSALIVGYGLLRVGSVRPSASCATRVFATVQQRTVRKAALQTFEHLHRAAAALPPRPPDRRPVARDRARHARHPVGAAARGVQHHADADRDAAGHRASSGACSTGASPRSPSSRWRSTSASP